MIIELMILFLATVLTVLVFFLIFLQKNIIKFITQLESTVYIFSLTVASITIFINLNNYFTCLTLLSFLVPSFVMFFYNLHRPATTRLKINLAISLIFLSLVFVLESSNVVFIVFGFELIVFITLYLLVITIKTDRGVTAVLELFI